MHGQQNIKFILYSLADPSAIEHNGFLFRHRLINFPA